MIHSITSNLTDFKNLSLGKGLNIILAEKSEGATDRQTRNGAGKSSLLELVHFLFGSNPDKHSIFKTTALGSASFTAQIDFGDAVLTVSRSGAKPGTVLVQGGIADLLPGTMDLETETSSLSNDHWKQLLGRKFFGLADRDDESSQERFRPSFRPLFSYFARRASEGGLSDAVQFRKNQLEWEKQVAVSYLLGLDARPSQELQEIRGQEKVIKTLGKAVKDGELGIFFGTAAAIRTQLAIAVDRHRRLLRQVENFRVIDEYANLEKEASNLTAKISGLNNENTLDLNLITQLNDSLETESIPAISKLDSLYKEAGVLLPEAVGRRFEDVTQFHNAVIANRRSHLSAEIASAEARRKVRYAERDNLDARRSQVMAILKSGGALDHYAKLQEELGRAEATTENLRQKFETAGKIEQTKVELKIARARVMQALQADLNERQTIVEQAILIFERLSNSLYDKAGSLSIEATSEGLKTTIEIDAQRSKGIRNMQIFCFDLMLAELATQRGLGPGFLIHDSHLFDGVDERQVAKALQLGAAHADAVGFQYIVMLNSDAVPQDGFGPGFDVQKFVNPTKLTDATETGGLFGLRFN